MPELRKDPVIGRWVIIATERGKRPMHYTIEPEKRKNKECAFCAYHESETPPEILAYREAGTAPNTPGWWVRVVPNRFPALKSEGELNREGIGMYDKMNGVGAHEVVIETPDHNATLATLEEKYVQEVIWAYRDRYLELKKDPRFRFIMIFKNQGSTAGASLEHAHSQIIALPIIPKRVKEELDGAREYFDYKERCVFCDIIHQEVSMGSRVVMENEDFLSFCPFASRFPFETWIIPKKHASSFENIKKSEVVNFAQVLKGTLLKLKLALNDPPYNYILHCAPCNGMSSALPYYHWHIEIMPRLTNVAGFEWGTGFYINPTEPETAAEELRKIEL